MNFLQKIIKEQQIYQLFAQRYPHYVLFKEVQNILQNNYEEMMKFKTRTAPRQAPGHRPCCRAPLCVYTATAVCLSDKPENS